MFDPPPASSSPSPVVLPNIYPGDNNIVGVYDCDPEAGGGERVGSCQGGRQWEGTMKGREGVPKRGRDGGKVTPNPPAASSVGS